MAGTKCRPELCPERNCHDDRSADRVALRCNGRGVFRISIRDSEERQIGFSSLCDSVKEREAAICEAGSGFASVRSGFNCRLQGWWLLAWRAAPRRRFHPQKKRHPSGKSQMSAKMKVSSPRQRMSSSGSQGAIMPARRFAIGRKRQNDGTVIF